MIWAKGSQTSFGAYWPVSRWNFIRVNINVNNTRVKTIFSSLLKSLCGIRGVEDIRALREAVGKPVSLQILNWLETDLTREEVESVAALATFPLVPLMTVVQALRDNLAVLAADHGSGKLPRARTSMEEFKGLIGYTDVVALQQSCGAA